MTVLLEVDDLFKAHKRHPVLRGVSFHLAAGEIIGLVGENGIGKTTLMSILAGDYHADSGRITLNGVPFEVPDHVEARHRGVGIIRQHFSINPNLTVAQAIYRESYQAGRPHEELRRGASQLLSDIGAELSPDFLIGDLQRAEHATVEAVRMLAEDASLVIMDEVGATFNLHELEDLHFIVSRLARQGRGVLYISHRLREIKHIADRIAVLRDGRISTVLDTGKVSTDEIAQAMFAREVPPSPRAVPPRDDVALSVREWSAGDRVRAVSFDLHAGEILGVTGPRNSGMHELALGIAGRLPTTWKQLTVHGRNRVITSPEDAAAAGIGYFSDDDIGITSESETIASFLLSRQHRPGFSDLASEVSGLREVIGRIRLLQLKVLGMGRGVGTLSGGDRQKAALTRWMAEDLDILVLSEPTRGLDITARVTLLEILREQVANGRAALVVSSAVDDLVEWADRILVMREGSIVHAVEQPDYDLRAIGDVIGNDPNSIARRAYDPTIRGPRRVLRI